jgi:cobaltochelatase CobN
MEMKSSLIPRGVHVIGKELNNDDITDYLLAALRFERGEIRSPQRILCAARSADWDTARKQPSAKSAGGKLNGEILNAVDRETRTLIKEVVAEGRSLSQVLGQMGLKLSRDSRDQMQRTLDFGNEVARNLKASVKREIEGILRALNGEYISPGIGGDPVRSPDILPTGRNMVGFDARRVPTKIAEQRASLIARQILDDYQKEHGEYPESIGVVLFSLEVMQTHGETVAEILELIGVRPVRSEAGYSDFTRYTVIPIEELGRPRIDIAVDISGIFRDTFPELLQFLGKVIKAVADLDEPPEKNYVRKHSLEIEKNLLASGQSPAEAREFSRIRTFGVGAGSYGTNICKMIAASDWEGEKEIAELYLDKQSHFYGDGVYDKKNPQALNEILRHVSVCAQVRSTSLYGVSDLDHYYEHLGGFTSSVSHVQKKKPVVMVADSSSEKVVTRRLGKQLEVEARTRFLNDSWIEGMLGSGSRGMKIMADRAEHMVGWAATTKDVDTRIFKEIAHKYVFDDKTRKRIMQENPWTLNDIMKKLMEAYQRGYWQATKEELERTKQIYLELEEEIEDREE